MTKKLCDAILEEAAKSGIKFDGEDNQIEDNQLTSLQNDINPCNEEILNAINSADLIAENGNPLTSKEKLIAAEIATNLGLEAKDLFAPEKTLSRHNSQEIGQRAAAI